MTSSRILVTGGSGFIGTHLIDSLLNAGHDVRNLDVKPPAGEAHRAHWAEADLMDLRALTEALCDYRPSIVYNLAAVANISVGPEALLPNSQGLRNLLEAARAAASRPRIVQASTQLVVTAGYSPVSERDYAPYTAYGESKAESEKILWEEASDFVWTILRPTNVWGPMHPSFPQSTWKLLKRRLYMLPSQSDPVRSYGYVGNVIAQMIAAGTLGAEMVNRRVFYVGDEPIPSSIWIDGFSRALTGKQCRRMPYSFLRFLAACGEVSKRLGGPAPFDAGRLYRITTDYPVPMQPTFDVLGRGSVSVAEGIDRTVAWLRSALPGEYRR